ncbi:MAG TPA: carboxylating nicotinate-nucleotide diphosphorylase [Rhizomicrobium sp.]|nr:carboxylating nicotinate-nucleotide diphosphorylase [Rhizomicrobium sp.]
MAFTRAPSPLLIEPQVRAALNEDLGRAGDITSDLTIAAGKQATARLVARKPGRIAGLICAEAAFRLLEPSVKFDVALPDGSDAAAGNVLAAISGPARSILTAERVALNFLGPLSGTASLTAQLVKAVEGTKARIVCTRKTLPGLRVLQKYAVRCGGGFNHRFGLDDAAMIKDNHIQAAGGIAPALARLRAGLGHMVKIEVEVDRLEQLEEALANGADTILLDNMSLEDMRRAVALANGKAVLEASGNVTLQTVRAIAETGVDTISSGAITHSAPNLDIGLDF